MNKTWNCKYLYLYIIIQYNTLRYNTLQYNILLNRTIVNYTIHGIVTNQVNRLIYSLVKFIDVFPK